MAATKFSSRTGHGPVLDGPPHPARDRVRHGLRRNLGAHGFLIGAVLCFVLFSWYPMVKEVILSFQKTRAGQTHWVGWHNFVQIVHDPTFVQAWANTGLFTGLALLLGAAVPFAVAVLFNELRHLRGYLRVLVYLPVMLPPVASLLLFKYFYDPSFGLFNDILSTLHLPTSQWLQSPRIAMLCVVIASTWMNMGGTTLIYLAGLQNIQGDLYEAAELDGAGLWRRVWHVTIPQMRLVISLMLLLQVVATMQVFVEPYLLTGGNGVSGSTITIVYLIYEYAFNFGNYGAACALGLMLLVVLAVFSAVYTRLTREES